MHAYPGARSSLRLVLLNGNAIGDVGAIALGGALENAKVVSQLEGLYAGANGITDAGADALLAALPSMPSLRELALHGNPLSNATRTRARNLLAPRWAGQQSLADAERDGATGLFRASTGGSHALGGYR